MKIVPGFPEEQRATVAALFWEAFSGKLGRVLGPDRKALRFLETVLTSDHALCVLSGTGEVIGVAGYKTAQGGLVAAGFRELAGIYGPFGALWRGPLLDRLERPLKPDQMLLDGIFVSAAMRGQGVGSALIGAVIAEAQRRGLREVRLDVVDINLRARALYERHGFVAIGRIETGIFGRVFGFHHATTMGRKLAAQQEAPPT